MKVIGALILAAFVAACAVQERTNFAEMWPGAPNNPALGAIRERAVGPIGMGVYELLEALQPLIDAGDPRAMVTAARQYTLADTWTESIKDCDKAWELMRQAIEATYSWPVSDEMKEVTRRWVRYAAFRPNVGIATRCPGQTLVGAYAGQERINFAKMWLGAPNNAALDELVERVGRWRDQELVKDLQPLIEAGDPRAMVWTAVQYTAADTSTESIKDCDKAWDLMREAIEATYSWPVSDEMKEETRGWVRYEAFRPDGFFARCPEQTLDR